MDGKTSITIKALAIDEDGDELTYYLYVNGTLKTTSEATASGTEVSLVASDLLASSTYTYYVKVVDECGEEVISDEGEAQTVCGGTVLFTRGSTTGTCDLYKYCGNIGFLYEQSYSCTGCNLNSTMKLCQDYHASQSYYYNHYPVE